MSRLIISFLVFLGAVLILTVGIFLWSGEPATNTPANKTADEQPTGDISLFVSYDGGETWSGLSTSGGLTISAFAFKKGEESRFYLGTRGQGLWLLDRDGKTLRRVTDPNNILHDDAHIYGIAQNAAGNALYVAIYQGNIGQVLRLRENGAEKLYQSSLEGYGIFGVAVSQENDRRIVIASAADGFLESVDGGKTWSAISRIRDGITRLIPHPVVEGKLFALNDKNKLYVTQTWGRLWSERPAISLSGSGSVGTLNDLYVSELRDSLLAGTDYSVVESGDEGLTWHTFQALPITPRSLAITAVVSHPRFSEVFWIGARNQVYRTDDGGVTWRFTQLPVEGMVTYLRVDVHNPKTIYAGLSR